MCMYVGEHVCRPSLLCNPVTDKIDNNNNHNNNNNNNLSVLHADGTLEILPIMPALCSMLFNAHYVQNYAEY